MDKIFMNASKEKKKISLREEERWMIQDNDCILLNSSQTKQYSLWILGCPLYLILLQTSRQQSLAKIIKGTFTDSVLRAEHFAGGCFHSRCLKTIAA